MTAWVCLACGPVSPDEVTVTAESPDETEKHVCGRGVLFVGWPAWEDVRHTGVSVSVLAI